MVEFEYQPWKKIVIHEVQKIPLQNFVMGASLGIEAGGIGKLLKWVGGFIIEQILLPDTEDVVREKLRGVVHYSSLTYAVMEKCEKEIKVDSGIRIPIVDVSDNPTFKELASWIRTNFEKKS